LEVRETQIKPTLYLATENTNMMRSARVLTFSLAILSLSAAKNMDRHDEVPEPTTNQCRGTDHEQAKYPAQTTNRTICDPKADQNLLFDKHETLHLKMFASQLQKPCDHFFTTSPSDGDKFHKTSDDDTCTSRETQITDITVLYSISHSALKNREVKISLIQFLLMTMNYKT
jgi:hypothetical protein